MVRIIAAMLAGLLLGIALTYFAFLAEPERPADEVVRDIVDVPSMAWTDATRHRDEHFVSLNTIDELQELPTEFDRAEALYAIVGRADSKTLQRLAFEANRIVDDIWRERAQSIIFFRLTELDPNSALALAYTDYFVEERNIDARVWRTWARTDLEAAISAAMKLDDDERREKSVQMLYAAHGYMNTLATQRIAEVTEIDPDQSTRRRFLYRLADRSPNEAVEFINGMEELDWQKDLVTTLAHFLARDDYRAAASLTERFQNSEHRASYQRIVLNYLAADDPESAFTTLMDIRSPGKLTTDEKRKFRALAKTDLAAAIRTQEKYTDPKMAKALHEIIVTEYAKQDPTAALKWVRSIEEVELGPLEGRLIKELVKSRPELALQAALQIDDDSKRTRLLQTVVSDIAKKDAASATTYLNQITDSADWNVAVKSIAAQWMRSDSTSAIEWLLATDAQVADEFLSMPTVHIRRIDVDEASSLLARIPEKYRSEWRRQIVTRIAAEKSADEAMLFAAQFKGQPGFDRLQSNIIGEVAKKDVAEARRMAEQLAPGEAKNAAYADIIGQHARSDPAEAAEWLARLEDDGFRRAATQKVVSQWMYKDREAAKNWISNLPPGEKRDDTIMSMAAQFGSDTPADRDLVASIGDAAKRQQAQAMRLLSLARTDAAQARKELKRLELPELFRQQMEMAITQLENRRY